MKWIGQHIWDFISRFRSDVYLEATDSGTIASGGNLGLDSNNKIVKSASPAGEIDLASAEVTGVLTVDHGGTGASSLTDNAILTGTGASPITAESTLLYDGNSMSMTGVLASVFLTNTAANTADSHIDFYNSRGGADGVDGDDCGTFAFYGNNNASGTAEKIQYGSIKTSIQERDDGDEAGIMRLQVATSNDSTSSIQQALTATGHGTANTVDVSLGYGGTSTTTIAGTLTMGSTAAMTNAGLLSVANQSNITGLGTISSGTWQGTDIGVAHGGTGLSTVGTNQILTGNGVGALTSESDLKFNGNTLSLTRDDNAGGPAITLQNDHADATGALLNFYQSQDGGDDDIIGRIHWFGKNESSGAADYGRIQCTIADATHNEEAGKLEVQVSEYDGTLTTGLLLDGDTDANGEIDVTIGAGAASVTTIAGTLTMGSTAAMTNAGLLSVANQSNITGVGTISSGTWQGTAVASAYLDSDTAHLTTNQTFTGIKTIVARRFTKSSDTDHNYLGDIVTFGTADGSLALGDICYLHTDGSWVPAIAGSDNAGTGKLLGVALGADPNSDGMLLRGMITLDHNTGDSNDGEPIYLHTSSAGSATGTIPASSGNIVRVLGYKMGDDDEVWFNPDNTYIERA